MSKDTEDRNTSAKIDEGNLVRFEPRMSVSAVLGVKILAQDGTVVLALQGPRNPRVEIVMPVEVAEVVLATISRALDRAKQAPPAP